MSKEEHLELKKILDEYERLHMIQVAQKILSPSHIGLFETSRFRFKAI
ncbi:hypothetical protein JFL43_07640 [Viridibacillus sp. YIM B01967]|uniref:Transposase n=1 Tax=Viridibacillus soli TaxID=2798301 RepID=A0ABS1H5Q1_9BACL|nr:hypothetical protein [Viridibacillus soli]MBK3494732.1 hypothetical protein [Viridibacillus soli]